MHALSVLSLVLAVFFAALGSAKVLALPPMRRRAQHLGLTVTTYRGIGALELAAAAGILVGFVVKGLGALAALGLLLLLAGALVTHVRSRDRLQETAPAIIAAALVAVYLALLVGAS